MKIGQKDAFQAIFNAFQYLIKNGLINHKIEWLGDYPLLTITSPRDIYLTFLILDIERNWQPFEFITNQSFFDYYEDENVNDIFNNNRFIAFIYLDAPYYSDYYKKQLAPQQEEIKKLFKKKYGLENLNIIQSDNLYKDGTNSIRESITNLFVVRFFMLKGYMVREDIGSGPDVLAFKVKLLEELRERNFIGKGASISQLATLRTFGKLNEKYKQKVSNEEIIAIETEANYPRQGIDQLIKGFRGKPFDYMNWLDKKVLAAPFFGEKLEALDLLTYNSSEFKYVKCTEKYHLLDFDKSLKFEYLKKLNNDIKKMLLTNLSFDEIISMISTKSLTLYQVLQKIPKIKLEKVLDKVESII